MLCARVLKGHHGGGKQFILLRIFEAFKQRLKYYEWSLDKVLKYKSVTWSSRCSAG
jgi:HAE1 family hydrophobic/amphiphilic exporter-1